MKPNRTLRWGQAAVEWGVIALLALMVATMASKIVVFLIAVAYLVTGATS